MNEYSLPPPPGNYRTMKFSQPFRNETLIPTVLLNTDPSVILHPNEFVEIEWNPSLNDGTWKVRLPS